MEALFDGLLRTVFIIIVSVHALIFFQNFGVQPALLKRRMILKQFPTVLVKQTSLPQVCDLLLL